MTRVSILVASIALALGLVGCASHPPKVDCEGKLRPINAAAPITPSDSARHEG